MKALSYDLAIKHNPKYAMVANSTTFKCARVILQATVQLYNLVQNTVQFYSLVQRAINARGLGNQAVYNLVCTYHHHHQSDHHHSDHHHQFQNITTIILYEDNAKH